ncbi:diguanylate cyclase [Salinimonas sp. HHU 13199]|uniref:diguanylate cyclase n=1 Tax=Salinimonas profundi TaxID=2729140 RepID=A0ABR8LKR1_9ALTE|nr:diguanylate cyclase [Salinimonas profundi]MBD3586784.1 diguanylate cyclase [Salinimonas profundi]
MMQLHASTPRIYDGWLLLVFVLVAGFLAFIYQTLTPYQGNEASVSALSYYVEGDTGTSLAEVTKIPSKTWKPVSNPVNLGMHEAGHWFRFKLPARASQHDHILEINYPLLDNVDVFVFDSSGQKLLRHFVSGDERIYIQRSLLVPTLAFELPPTSGALQVYLRVESSGSIKVPLRYWEKERFVSYTASHNLMMGLFLGVLFAVGVSNFFLFITNRSTTFFVYSGYVFSLALTIAAMHGIGYAIIWPEQVWFQGRAVAIFANATIMFAVLFSDRILNVSRYSLRLSRALKIVAELFFISLLVSFILPYSFLIKAFLIMVSFTVIFTLTVGIWIAIKGVRIARYYAFAWFILLLSAFTASLDNLGIITSPVPSNFLLMLGASIETLLLALVLAINYSHNREQVFAIKEQALSQEKAMLKTREELLNVQQQYQEELEYQVQERTLELEVALRELSDANQELSTLNTTDPLTGIRNRRHFDKRLQAESRRSRREQTPLSIALIDIDHFKQINDDYGHTIGDTCLCQVAERLKAQLKRPGDDVCRYGGEEFVVLLPNTELTGAQQVAESMRQAIAAQPLDIDDNKLHITISAGVVTSVIISDGQEAELFNHADKLLYAAKAAGRNQVIAEQLPGQTS